MVDSIVYVPGQGEGIIDAICDDNPSGGMRKLSYLIIFGKGDRSHARWVESSKVRITGALQPKLPAKASFQED